MENHDSSKNAASNEKSILAQPAVNPEELLSLPLDELLVRLDTSSGWSKFSRGNEQVVQNLQHLRRAGLISVNWRSRTIKREKPLKVYVTKNVIASGLWPTMSEDWNRLAKTVSDKHGKVNTEYLELLSPKQR